MFVCLYCCAFLPSTVLNISACVYNAQYFVLFPVYGGVHMSACTCSNYYTIHACA